MLLLVILHWFYMMLQVYSLPSAKVWAKAESEARVGAVAFKAQDDNQQSWRCYNYNNYTEM